MAVVHHWRVSDLEQLPDDGNRYEIIGGELYVSKQPHFYHQRICLSIGARLDVWDDQTGLGVANLAPGIIFSDEDAVAPDLIWISKARLASALNTNGKLYEAPELVIEVLSRGKANEHRDRDSKLDLYSSRGVRESWLVDWRARCIEVYRSDGSKLVPVAILHPDDALETTLLPGFSCQIESLFADIPATLAVD
ncbi:MAG TPA: Uma2 family endonuclease [Blastocatellia bacterium]|nr:Uma2 family endonuclease [Blastocatellia bacterium]